ncbi:hypothetical protein H072_2322 [Dactylellina haptotyla CBS 200.50]|uniref:CSC1/OSCA1-like 7TM region domain-containing protein n=1 Tax=Dactylellina haptotyla (strain CBS 200.50) TaxID=1284197 RepID=S8C7L0_DACHA|nr:hypothetical protein H072_2322 [Dactylellina haptotyla CBS 200.50]
MGYRHDIFHALQKRAAQCGSIANQANNGDTGSALDPKSNSLSGFLSSLIVNGIIFAVMLLLFLILRKSQRRQYAPRTYVGTVNKAKRTDPLPEGLFSWVKPLIAINESYVIEKTSLDSYFFLRYLKMSAIMMFVGCCITWPILFPLNITGGAGQKQLDVLAMGNVQKTTHKNWYYGHVLAAYLFFGFVLFTIYRELMHFIAVRQAYLCSSMYANRVSARTILVTSIPEEYLSVPQLLKLFDNVARIWINTNVKELEETVAERDKLALKLEGAEIKYIKTADKNRRTALKKGTAGEGDAESGSVGARWVPAKQRPTHKLKFLVGQKVDTIDWSRTELKNLNAKISELQARQRTDKVEQLNSAFIEFSTQQAAQIAFQCLASNLPLHMAPRYIGITPDEVVWSSLRLKWWERLVKITLVTAFIAVLVIFWAVPVAVVGTISNINYLTCQLPWLKFIEKIPSSILGVITGLLPSVMLAVLMALLPIVLRLCARISGKPSLSTVELHVQNSYFAFQVIQVFLITTLTSAIAASWNDITKYISSPTEIMNLLATNIPKASNFYISYLLLQGLSVSAGALLQIVGLIVGKLLSFLFDTTPRKKWNRWTKLSGLGWGTVFPVFTNIVVIALTYAPIAPLILGFGTIGISLFYLAYKHNLLFVYDNSIDTKGMVYPRALYQTLTGVYLAEVCMIGLFILATTPGPIALSIILLVLTILFQIALTNAFGPMLEPLPRNLQVADNNPATSGDMEANGGGATNGEKSDATAVAHEAPPNPGFLKKFFQPHLYANYMSARALIPQNEFEYTYSHEERENAYVHPAVSATEPILWLAKDEAGVSTEEIEGCKAFEIVASDEFAWIDEKSKVQWEPVVDESEVHPPDYSEKAPM